MNLQNVYNKLHTFTIHRSKNKDYLRNRLCYNQEIRDLINEYKPSKIFIGGYMKIESDLTDAISAWCTRNNIKVTFYENDDGSVTAAPRINNDTQFNEFQQFLETLKNE